MRKRMLPVLLVALSVASATVAVIPLLQGPASSSSAATQPTTPVFSLRRAPALVSRTVAGRRLVAELDGILGQPALGPAQDQTCLAVRDPDGRPIYERQISTPLIPASTTKVVTGAVAITRLGADARYVTEVKAAGGFQDGAVGDLWLVGSGDPLLGTGDFAATAGWLETPRPYTSLESLADRIAVAGVRRVGRLLGDESRYDGQRYVPSWEPSYATVPEVGPQSALTVNDGYVQWEPRKVAAGAPATHGATVLADLLRGRGVAVDGVGEGQAPAGLEPVASMESLPMHEVVGVVLRDSGNLASELLVKELGARFGGGGTTSAGLNVVRSTLSEMGLAVDGLESVDGSGLDRGDRVTCDLLQDLLATDGENGPLAQGLPVAGRTGTLLRRFRSTPASGKVRAKTGSLDEVIGLSGWATAGDGRSLLFSLVANGLPFDDLGFALQDRVVSALVSYPQAPAPDDIAPGPPRAPPEGS
ncbi:MAG: D-alanyl-D-alanine carboxypeptidase/D-alanyl-D-alanine-endopeptidase [Acidimicrobiales bacterium]